MSLLQHCFEGARSVLQDLSSELFSFYYDNIKRGVFRKLLFATVRHPGSQSDQINVFADIHYPRLVLLYVGGLIRDSLELNQNTDRNENRNCLHIEKTFILEELSEIH